MDNLAPAVAVSNHRVGIICQGTGITLGYDMCFDMTYGNSY